MKFFVKVKKIICKIVIIFSILFISIPILSFIVLSMFFVLFNIGANSNIDVIKNITYKINDKISGTNYYDMSIIEDKVVLNDGKFIITEKNDKFNLIMYTQYNKIQYIFTNCFCWDILDNRVYIIGDNEYAVIYTDNNKREKCKILLKSDNVLIDDIMKYSEDIIILNDFEEFTENERDEFVKIKTNGSIFCKL